MVDLRLAKTRQASFAVENKYVFSPATIYTKLLKTCVIEKGHWLQRGVEISGAN